MIPSVSVVITALGDAPGLPETIAGLAAQTRGAAEVVVVTDRDRDIPVGVTPSPGLLRVPTGPVASAAARNAGLAATRSSHVQFLDPGDVLTPIALVAALSCVEQNPDAAFLYGAHRLVDGEGKPMGLRQRADLGNEAYAGLLEGRLVDAHAAVLYQRDLLQACGGFQEDLPTFADYDVHLRLARTHLVASLDAEIVRSPRPSRTVARARSSLDEALRVHRAHRPTAQDPPEWHQAWRAGERRLRDAFAREALEAVRAAGGPHRQAFLCAASLSPRLVAEAVGTRLLRRGAQALPTPLGDALARRRPDLRPLGVGRVRLGDLDRAEPVSRDFGFDRGLPVDRYYIEQFLEESRADVRGRVLEVGDAAYSQRFGGSQVVQQDVVHVHAGNPDATIVGDISRPGTLPRSAFDCIVLTQTLHLIWDMRAAVEELHAALKPGGVLLLTVPGISQIDRGEWGEQWYWALTPAAVRRLLGEVFGEEAVTVESHGNAYAATAFLQGLALTEVELRKLDIVDEAYPVIVTAHATRWVSGRSDDVGEGTLGAVEVDQPTDQHADG